MKVTNYYLELTGAGQDATHVARLQARSMFKDIRAEAEEYIYKKLVTCPCVIYDDLLFFSS